MTTPPSDTSAQLMVEHRFGYHRATFPAFDGDKMSGPLAERAGERDDEGNVATAPIHALVRQTCKDAANRLLEITPPGREQALMLTALQEASMWANAAVAMTSPLVTE